MIELTTSVTSWRFAQGGAGLLELTVDGEEILDPTRPVWLQMAGWQDTKAWIFLHSGQRLTLWLADEEGSLQSALSAGMTLRLVQSNDAPLMLPPGEELLVLAAEDEAVAACIHLARQLKGHRSLLVLMQWNHPQPFRPVPSRILLPEQPVGALAAIPLLEDLGVASRICAPEGVAGCYEGGLTEFRRHWPKAAQWVFV